MSATPQSQPSPHQDDYLRYLASRPNLKAEATFPARGRVGDDVPTFVMSTPFGTLVLLSDYLAFLTLSDVDPGAGVMMREAGRLLVDQLLDQVGLVGNLIEAAQSARERSKAAERAHKALRNPHSLFIPLSTVTGVEAGRHYTGVQYIKVKTTERNLIFFMEFESKNPFKQIGQLVGAWHPEVVERLREVARRNREGSAPRTAASSSLPQSTPQVSAPPAPASRPIPPAPASAPSAPLGYATAPMAYAPPSTPFVAPALSTPPMRKRHTGRNVVLAMLCLAVVAGGLALAARASRGLYYQSSGGPGASSGSAPYSSPPTPTPTVDHTFDPISVDPPTPIPTDTPIPPTATPIPPTFITRLLSGHYNTTYEGRNAAAGNYYLWFDLSFTNNTSQTQYVDGKDVHLRDGDGNYWNMVAWVNQGPFRVDPGYYLKDVRFVWVVPCSQTDFRLIYHPDSHTNVYWDQSTNGC